MKVISTKFLAFVSVMFVLLFSANTNASFITPSSAHVDQINIVNGSTDLVHVRAANSAGISINRFDRFEVTDTPLNLVNLPREGALPSAQRIIIIADTIVLNNTVKLVGPASDILFLSTDTVGSISCNACVLNNFYRISFAAANPEVALADAASTIGNLNTSSSGFVDINGLTAPGSIAFDVVANLLSLSGEINTHQRANKDSLGGYSEDINGNYSIGTGSVNLQLGSIKWDYESQKLVSLSASASQNILGGSIKAVRVNVTASSNLTFNTNTDTRTDLLSSVRYQNKPYIPFEGISVQTIGATSLTINGNQESNGNVVVKTTGDLDFPSSLTYLSGDLIELIAEGEILNAAIIDANHVQAAALRFQNEGHISSEVELEAWAKETIVNQYGGQLVANSIKLQSAEGVVRNGSRTPYQLSGSEVDYVTGTANYNNLDMYDPAKLGSFYLFGVDNYVSPGTSYVMAESNSAKINANQIEILAVGFENINPYYERVNDLGEIDLNREHIEQVSLSAETYLAVQATNYIINSSAVMHVHNEAGNLQLQTALLTNERYRATSILEKTEYTSSEEVPLCDGCDYLVDVDTDTTIISAKTVVYSPPGFLISMGDLNISASESVVNNTAFIEVFGSAKFNTPIMHDIGAVNESYQQDNILPTGSPTHDWCMQVIVNGGPPDVAFCYYLLGMSASLEEVTETSSGEELVSLLFVQNDASFFYNTHTNDSTQIFKNHSPIESFIQQAAENLVSQTEATLTEYDFYHYYDVNDSKANEGLSLQIDWEVYHSPDGQAQLDQNGFIDPTTATVTSGTDTYSIIEELIKLYDQLLDYFAEIYAEIDWWG